MTVPCPDCDGTGRIEWDEDCWSYYADCHYTAHRTAECETCYGTGEVPAEEPEEGDAA